MVGDARNESPSDWAPSFVQKKVQGGLLLIQNPRSKIQNYLTCVTTYLAMYHFTRPNTTARGTEQNPTPIRTANTTEAFFSIAEYRGCETPSVWNMLQIPW